MEAIPIDKRKLIGTALFLIGLALLKFGPPTDLYRIGGLTLMLVAAWLFFWGRRFDDVLDFSYPRSFKFRAAGVFIPGCFLYYIGFENAFNRSYEAAFWLTSLLSMPFGIWIGMFSVASLRLKIKERTLIYQNRWEEIAGARNIHIVFAWLALVTLLSLILLQSMTISCDHIIFLIATITLAIVLTIMVVVRAYELLWGIKYEWQAGYRLNCAVKDGLLDSRLSGGLRAVFESKLTPTKTILIFIVLYFASKLF